MAAELERFGHVLRRLFVLNFTLSDRTRTTATPRGLGGCEARMSWTLDSRATPNQAGIFAGRSLPKLPLVRFREHVARSSLSPFLRRFLLIFPGYLFSSPLLHLGCLHYSARMRLLLPHRCFIPLLSRALLPFAPAHTRILLGQTPRRRTRLPNTANSRANTPTHNFHNYFARSHPHRRHPAS
jgi:hypothetical protein